jgi:hypothetical protein
MVRTFEQAVHLVEAARRDQHPLIKRMIAVRNEYNADVVLPTGDLGGAQPGRPPGPLLIVDAIDKQALQANLSMPVITVPHDSNAEKAGKWAKEKERAIKGFWHHSGLFETVTPRAFRQLKAYGTFGMRIDFNTETKNIRIVGLNPLNTYSEPKAFEDFDFPGWVAEVNQMSSSSIKAKYPHAEHHVGKYAEWSGDNMWDIVRFQDNDSIYLGLLGPSDRFGTSTTVAKNRTVVPYFKLARWDNPIGMVPAYLSRILSLDQIESSVMKLLPQVYHIGRLRALDMAAAEKGVFPDLVAFGDSGKAVRVGGDWVDGRDGGINVIENARGFQTVNMNPSDVSRRVTEGLEDDFNRSAGMDPAAA